MYYIHAVITACAGCPRSSANVSGVNDQKSQQCNSG